MKGFKVSKSKVSLGKISKIKKGAQVEKGSILLKNDSRTALIRHHGLGKLKYKLVLEKEEGES